MFSFFLKAVKQHPLIWISRLNKNLNTRSRLIISRIYMVRIYSPLDNAAYNILSM